MPVERWFRRSLIAFVIAFAFLNFSENTADLDLWGHVLFGHRLLATGQLPQIDPYSWTAGATPWINHELIAEIALAWVHKLAGGSGIFFLMLAFGLGTFAMAIRLGSERLDSSQRIVTLLLGFLAAPQIAFGFAARPQMFTALFLVLMIWIVRRMHEGKWWMSAWLVPMFVLWVNAHGGVIAAVVLMWIIAGATTFERIAQKQFDWKKLVWLWAAAFLVTACLPVNPWGGAFVSWLIGSVTWLRPQIEEWQPAAATLNNAGFFAIIALAVVAFAFSKRQRPLWEIAVCAALAVASLRSVRHTPLFCLAAVAILPAHLADAASRLKETTAALRESFAKPAMQTILAIAFAVAAVATLWASLTRGKEHPFTMEAPRSQYPFSAIAFIRDHDLRGNMINYFDWGELCLWELPDCRPSIDGRLDTCYSHALIDAHWNFYSGKALASDVLDIAKADFVLMPHLDGAKSLSQQAGWMVAYADPIAVVIVRDAARFPKLAKLELPVVAGKSAVQGRVSFPEELNRR